MVETKLTREEIKTTVVRTVINLLQVRAALVTEEANLREDLMADSLDVAELVIELEKEFGREIPDEAGDNLATVGGLIDYLFANQG